jgi:hypothetical protein
VAVRALIATNAFHTLGIASWKARFPDASVFAPAQSLARVTQVSGTGDLSATPTRLQELFRQRS